MMIDGTSLAAGATIVAIVALAAWAIREPHLMRLSLRYVWRNRARTLIVIAGLMLATILVEAATVVNDAIVLAVKQVAITSVGKVDEEVSSGGQGLGLFTTDQGRMIAASLNGNPLVSGVTPALEVTGTLVVNQSARQVHGGITLLGMASDEAGPLTDLKDMRGKPVRLGTLPADGAVINTRAAELLSAAPGDALSSYSGFWTGQTLTMHVAHVVDAGPLGKSPTVFVPLATLQAIAAAPDQVNRVFIANAGDPLSALAQSAAIADRVGTVVPPGFQILQAKAAAVNYALETETLFGRILTLYTLFALAVDVLLVFLIFSLLAAERRNELGTLRALGLQRGEIVATMAFEAAIYNLGATIPGALAGLGLGAAIIAIISPAVAALGFPLTIPVTPGAFISAVCLGFLFSLAVTIVAIWATSRLSIAAALRNLPDPPASPPTFADILQRGRAGLRAPLALGRVGVALLWGATWRGLLPLVVGLVIFGRAMRQGDLLFVPLGWVVAISGGILVVRWLFLWQSAARVGRLAEDQRLSAIGRATDFANRASALLGGGYLVAFWGVPETLARFVGPHRFSGGLEGFFVAGLLMVLGAILALTANLGGILEPLRRLGARRGRWRHVQAIALVYPAAQRWRSGIVLALFALVCFVMLVMASLANSTTQRFADVGNLTGGYDIIAQPLSHPIGDLATFQKTLAAKDPQVAAKIRTISAAAALPLATVAPGANDAGWRLYPVASIEGAFLNGDGLPLVARAQGFASDAAVWQSVHDHLGDVVIDAGALDPDQAAQLGIQVPPVPPIERFAAPPIAATLLGPDALASATSQPQTQALLNQTTPEVREILRQPDRLRAYTLRLSNLTDAQGQFQPTTIWAEDFRGQTLSLRLRVIAIVDNVQGQRYGMLGTPATFAPLEQNLAPIGNDYFYFALQPGADPQEVARALSADFLDAGFETTVIRQALMDLNAPQVFASEVLLRLVALMLLVGTAALMISGLRSVIERRQQIGMLRALGYQRWDILLIFIIETLVIAAGGAIVGLVIGLLLCRNGFAVTFVDTTQVGIALIIPWGAIAIIALIVIALATLAVIIPAWLASRIAPAEALRYE